MKLKEGFILHDVGGEHMGVATGRAGEALHGLVRNNDTANFIFQMLLTETTEEAITAAMVEKYDAPEDVIAEDVHALIAKLCKAGLIDE